MLSSSQIVVTNDSNEIKDETYYKKAKLEIEKEETNFSLRSINKITSPKRIIRQRKSRLETTTDSLDRSMDLLSQKAVNKSRGRPRGTHQHQVGHNHMSGFYQTIINNPKYQYNFNKDLGSQGSISNLQSLTVPETEKESNAFNSKRYDSISAI